jgi:hypothetical protein
MIAPRRGVRAGGKDSLGPSPQVPWLLMECGGKPSTFSASLAFKGNGRYEVAGL